MLGPLEKLSPRSVFEGREIVVATILSVVWLILLAGYGAGYFGLLGDIAEPRDAAFLEIMFFLIVLVLPLSFVWLGSALIRRSFQIQDEARRLEREVRELQSSGSAQSQAGVSQPRIKDNRVETLQKRVTEMSNHLKQMETTITSVRQMQAAMQTQVSPNREPDTSVAPPIPEPAEPILDWPNMLLALNFPRDEKDAEGFRALRIAKRDENAGRLLRAAEDMLNLLAQEGIYMDDLRPTIAPAYDWRNFAEGTRGSDVASVGGIIAPEAMERIKAREKNDQIFKDTSLYFLRRFDIMLKSFVEGASDGQIQQLADTRTGRAFMLLGRAAGMFG